MSMTSTQSEELLEFMLVNKDLARGLIRCIDGRAQAKQLWEDLTLRLNSLGCAVKTVQQWKKVWADKKYLGKRASAAARRSAAGTGGGPPTAEILSQEMMKVISVMGVGFGEPDVPAGRVPAFPEPLEELRAKVEGMQLVTPVCPMPVDAALAPPQARPANVVRAARRQGRRLHPVQMQVQMYAAACSIHIEETKNETLKGIHVQMQQLNDTIKELSGTMNEISGTMKVITQFLLK